MADVLNNGEQAPEGNARQTGERLLADATPIPAAQPTEAATPATTPSEVNRTGVIAEGADGFALVSQPAERQTVGMERASEALDSGRPVTIRVVGEEQARAMFEMLRDRVGSIQVAKEPYDVHRVPITSNSLVSTSENYVSTTGETQFTKPNGETVTLGANTTLPAGTIIEADGRIRSAHPQDAGITVNGQLIPNGSKVNDMKALSGGQNAAEGTIIPTRRITNLQNERVIDGYPLTPEQFAKKFQHMGDGRFQFKSDGTLSSMSVFRTM